MAKEFNFQDLCKPYAFSSLSPEIQTNIKQLCIKVNRLLRDYIGPVVETSCYRSQADEDRIYEQKNALRAQQNLPPLHTPTASMHLEGCAIDLLDADRAIRNFIMTQKDLYTALDLYFEDFTDSQNHLHIQIKPPHSLLRFFKA